MIRLDDLVLDAPAQAQRPLAQESKRIMTNELQIHKSTQRGLKLLTQCITSYSMMLHLSHRHTRNAHVLHENNGCITCLETNDKR